MSCQSFLSDDCAFLFACVNFNIYAHVQVLTQAYIHAFTYVCAAVLVACLCKICQNNLYIRNRYCRFHPYHLYIGTRESHHHSTRSPPSFLTGLEKKKREREGVQGRNCSFTFCCWHSCYYNLAEIIEVVKLLPVSPSVFIHLCLSSFQTRCKFEEPQSTLVKPFLKSSELAHGKHARRLTRRCTLPLHGSLMSLIHEIFFSSTVNST